MNYLLDVNVLIALLISRHQHHNRAEAWIAALSENDRVILCGWTEMAFLRIGLNTGDIPDLDTGRKALAGFRAGAARVGFVADGSRAADLPRWVQTAGQIGDGHLSTIATAASARLATFDTDIPGASLVP